MKMKPTLMVVHDGPGTLRPGIPLKLAFDHALPITNGVRTSIHYETLIANKDRATSGANAMDDEPDRLIEAEAVNDPNGGVTYFQDKLTELLEPFGLNDDTLQQYIAAISMLCEECYGAPEVEAMDRRKRFAHDSKRLRLDPVKKRQWEAENAKRQGYDIRSMFPDIDRITRAGDDFSTIEGRKWIK